MVLEGAERSELDLDGPRTVDPVTRYLSRRKPLMAAGAAVQRLRPPPNHVASGERHVGDVVKACVQGRHRERSSPVATRPLCRRSS